MITIGRYRARMAEVFTLELTEPGVILAVRAARADERDLEFWATADPDGAKVTRRITIVGTGHPIPEPWPGEHLGTTSHGAFVFHVCGDETIPGAKPNGGGSSA